ncbi:MAG: MurR/RpiR family transcriptional regulator [Proteobacteria bacterium]|nr:MurR/RpiR family transcriptional regulator [Pseudomonadota bacterium]
MIDFVTVQDKLHAVYPSLSAQLRNAARFVLKEPAYVALYPLRRVAVRAGVSPGTLVRLAAQLGFDTYNGFRDAFRDGMHSGMGSARYAADAQSLLSVKGRGAFEKVYRGAGELQLRNISETFNAIAPAEVETAGQTLARAKRIYILGMRANYAAAFYFDYVLKTFARNIVLLEDRMGMLIDELGDIGPRDALLALSGEPYAADAVKAVAYAVDAGASVIAITDNSLAPITQKAKHVFVVPTTGPSFYQSLVPTMALLECLVCLLVARGGPTAVERVKREFERRDRFGVYWRDKSGR